MRNNQNFLPPPENLRRRASQNQNNLLKAQLKGLEEIYMQKQKEILDYNYKIRSQGLRNQKLIKEISSTEERTHAFVCQNVDLYCEKNKNNKQSPLFYNQNGLSPFQMMKLKTQRFKQTPDQHHICMICYKDLRKDVKILILPCKHIIHKQCGIQHLLYSKNCPACNAQLK